jgi:hypothetical protein
MVESRVDKRKQSTGAMAAPAAKKTKTPAAPPVPASRPDPVPEHTKNTKKTGQLRNASHEFIPGEMPRDVRILDREAEASRARGEQREEVASRSSSRSSTRGREPYERREYQGRGSETHGGPALWTGRGLGRGGGGGGGGEYQGRRGGDEMRRGSGTRGPRRGQGRSLGAGGGGRGYYSSNPYYYEEDHRRYRGYRGGGGYRY